MLNCVSISVHEYVILPQTMRGIRDGVSEEARLTDTRGSIFRGKLEQPEKCAVPST